jgi:hypothetical protein
MQVVSFSVLFIRNVCDLAAKDGSSGGAKCSMTLDDWMMKPGNSGRNAR